MGGGGASGKKEAAWHLQVACFCVFAAGNIGLNYFNAWAMHSSDDGVPGHGKGGFQFPYFYTMFHMASTTLAALVMQLTCARSDPFELPSLTQLWNYKHALVPMAILTFFNNGFNNASLGSIALFVNQVIKAAGPLPTALFEFLFLGKINTLKVYVTIVFIVGGCALANYNSFLEGGSTEMAGLIQCLISLIAASLKPVIVKLVTSGMSGARPCAGACSCVTDLCTKQEESSTSAPKQKSLTPSQALFWDTGLSFFIFATMWFFSAERDASIAFLSSHTENPKSGLLGLGIISFGSFLAFIFNIATYYFIMYTSALTTTVGANGVKIFLIVMTAMDQNLTFISWGGVAVVVASICAYAAFAFQAGQPKAPKPAVVDEETPLAKAGPVTVSSEK